MRKVIGKSKNQKEYLLKKQQTENKKKIKRGTIQFLYPPECRTEIR